MSGGKDICLGLIQHAFISHTHTHAYSNTYKHEQTRAYLSLSLSNLQGVFTFDFSEDLNMLATGGADCSLRLWNPYVPSNPLAALPGHSSPITHLAFNVNYNQVITISHNEIIKIWDIVEHVCMNTLAAVIPHRTLQNKFPISCMLWHEKTQCLVTACKDELCVTQMSRHEETTASLTSHRAPLSCIKILPEFGHVITACTRGDLKVWDFTTGELLMELSAHTWWKRCI